MTRSRLRGGSLALVLSLLLVGCAGGATTEAGPEAPPPASAPAETTPSPATGSPEPTAPPAVEDLVLRPDGIGTLVIGTDAGLGDDPSDMLRFVEGYCETSETVGTRPDGTDFRDAWVHADVYFTVPEDPAKTAFGVAVEGGILREVEVIYPSRVETSEGVAPGSSVDEFLSAYPDAVVREEGVLSEVYEVRRDGSIMTFEVLIDAELSPWPDVDQPVTGIHVTEESERAMGPRWGSDNVLAPCAP